MLVLCGTLSSNYYNKVKLALLEKAVPFEERSVMISQDEALLERSPLGKVPYLETDRGSISESQVILEYIERLHPSPPLLDADPFLAAKQRELVTYIELHLELVARELYGEVYFGRGRTEETIRERVQRQLTRNIQALKRLMKPTPFLAGDHFSVVDCAGFVHFPLIGSATKAAYGEDMLLAAGIDWKSYAKRIGERESARKVQADRKAYLEAKKDQR